MALVEQARVLGRKFDAVVANPPYMGSGGMNPRLSAWAKSSYASSKMDLFSMFMERTTDLIQATGYVSMVTMQSWMFLSSYEKLRLLLLSKFQLCSLVQIGYNSFPELNSKVAQACAFIFEKSQREISGSYINLNDAPQSADKNPVFLGKKRDESIHWSKQSDFTKISGTPVAYWVTKSVFRCFEENQPIQKYAEVKNGMSTTDNERFTRLWYEVNIANVGLGLPSAADAKKSSKRWFPYNKGGLFRRWFGNFLQVVNWESDGREIKKAAEGASGGRIVSEECFFQRSMSWSKVSSGKFAVRMYDSGFIFDVAGPSVFSSNQDFYYFLGLLNSRINHPCLEQLSPTINFEAGQVSCFPIKRDSDSELAVSERAYALAAIARKDWDMAETSWSFSSFPLLASYTSNNPLDYCYAKFRDLARSQIQQTLQLEEENNRTLIGIYRLQDELTPEVPLSEITLTCNPHYRYGCDKSEQELEGLLCADTMREFISYAVGCMFGRYSLDKPGVILANQGETLADYLRQVPEPRFKPDADNVIPLLDGDWFPDDITGRFREFLRVTFGDEHYDENLRFIEAALGKKGKPLAIRDFFLKDFYTDHVKRYKKRPIYWLFSSPKGSFNALIYLHRYRPDTVSVVLQYLRDFRSKLAAHRAHLEQVSISTSASQGEKTKALKEIETLKKTQAELDDYERDTLYPLATHQVALDLDDGVKVNYAKLGAALKKIPGLDAADE